MTINQRKYCLITVSVKLERTNSKGSSMLNVVVFQTGGGSQHVRPVSPVLSVKGIATVQRWEPLPKPS